MKVNIYSNSDFDKKEEKRWHLVVEGSDIHADKVTVNCPTETSSDWIGNSLVDSMRCVASKLQMVHIDDRLEVIIY